MFKQQPTLRILIVDDVADVRADLRLLLEIAGDFQVVGEARNGREAIEQAGALHPDVVVMDLAMPILDGYQAATCIRSQFADLQIVALSVDSTEVSWQRAHAAGFNACVAKGAPLSELLGAISPRCSQNSSETGGLS